MKITLNHDGYFSVWNSNTYIKIVSHDDSESKILKYKKTQIITIEQTNGSTLWAFLNSVKEIWVTWNSHEFWCVQKQLNGWMNEGIWMSSINKTIKYL